VVRLASNGAFLKAPLPRAQARTQCRPDLPNDGYIEHPKSLQSINDAAEMLLRGLAKAILGSTATVNLLETGQNLYHAVGGVMIWYNGVPQTIVGGYETSTDAANQSALVRAIQWLTGEEIRLEAGGDAEYVKLAVVQRSVRPEEPICDPLDVGVAEAQHLGEFPLEAGHMVAQIPVDAAEGQKYVSWLSQYVVECAFQPGEGPPPAGQTVD